MPVKLLNPAHHSTQKKIVMYHNYFRSRVHPPAADMLAMVTNVFWYKEKQMYGRIVELLSP